MKTPNLLIAIVLACVLYSCGGGKYTTPSQQSLIQGKWTLQQQHLILTVNGTKQTDTVVNASATNHGDANFGKSGTFTSAGYYSNFNGGNLSSAPVTATDSTSGTYSIVNDQLSLNASIAGFVFSPSGNFTTGTIGPGTVPIYTLVSHTVKISQLSQSVLTLQTDYLYNETSPTAGAYESVNVYNFTR